MAQMTEPGPPPAYVYGPPQPDRFSSFVGRMWARSPRWVAPVGIFTCFLKLTTGFDCPGCGGTRAFWYVLHGNLPAAARHHAMFLFALPFLLYLYVAWAGREMFRWKLPMLRLSPKAIGWFLGAWALFTVVRNLPWAPFAWLYV